MRPPTRGQQLVHLGVHGVERRHVEQAAAEARLVGRDHHVPAGVVQPRDGLQRAGQRLSTRPAILTKSSLSALMVPSRSRMTSFMACRSGGQARQVGHAVHRLVQRCSRPRRFRRRSVSSALTITPSKKASTGARSAASVCSEAV